MFLRTNSACRNASVIYRCIRTFLSDEFKCQESWNSRVNADYMQKINMETLYYDIEQNIQKYGKPSAIDIDIYVNKACSKDEHRVEEIADLVNKLRLSEETTHTLDSTQHAVVRNFVDMGHITDLIKILDNRLDYGIFLDTYGACYLLNELITKKDYQSAARVSTLLMLQDDLEHELSQSLVLYACYKYLNKREPFYVSEEIKVDPKEKKEEIKVRVKFLRNPFFDNHFDLKNHDHLVGKTFLSISSKMKNSFEPSLKLMGLVLCQKYEEAINILKSPGRRFYKDILQHCLTCINEDKTENTMRESLNTILEKIILCPDQIQSECFDKDLEIYVKATVEKQEPLEIAKQKEKYIKWNDIRQGKLNDELERLQRTMRLKEVERLTADMKEEEQKLWFFENEDNIDLEIDRKKVFYPKRWFGKKKKPRVVDEGYVPPEIIKQRK